MISDKPKWCALMMNGIKNIEVRKNKALVNAIQKLIDKYGYADIYVYCSKDKKDFLVNADLIRPPFPHPRTYMLGHKDYSLNGKVLFKFRCYKVAEWHNYSWQEITKNACLTDDELRDYAKGVASVYCIHISDLEIFDTPKKLDEFMSIEQFNKYKKDLNEAYEEDEKTLSRLYNGYALDDECANCVELLEMTKWCYGLTKAPQNFCYVEVE